MKTSPAPGIPGHLRQNIISDFRASITVFFVALPLCLGIALASGAPVWSGLIAGMIGGLVIAPLSGSQLSVSGPAAGLTAVSAAAIGQLGTLEFFFAAVAFAGVLQLALGLFRLGGFTHFIPSAVIKGMLAGIGIILISKQIPAVLGYDQPQFWSNELFNIITLNHIFSNVRRLFSHTSAGAIIISLLSLTVLATWKRYLADRLYFVPASFATVVFGVLLAWLFERFWPVLALTPAQYVHLPSNFWHQVQLTNPAPVFAHAAVWKTAVVICFVASLETLLSVEAVDKLDPYNRITPPNRELMAQGVGNLVSGLTGGIPITAVIVRSSANAEAGARTRLSGFLHGVWLLLTVSLGVFMVNAIPYCVLGVILVRTGYQLAKPSMIRAVYRQGREQLLPFLVTAIAILLTDLLVGVVIGIIYSIYFLVKHTYRAGFVVHESTEGTTPHFVIELALNVSFLNKKRISALLDQLPAGSTVEISGTKSIYIDHDILEIFQDFRAKAGMRHIMLTMKDIPEVETIELH